MSVNIIKNLSILIFPSPIKIIIYKLMGSRIGKGCYIGFSLIDAKTLEIGDYVYIGHFNLIWRLRRLKMRSGSRISSFNWITGAMSGYLDMGINSSIRRFHFLEASAGISIGNNTIIAGRSSQFFTHGLSPTNLDDTRSIKLGDWCYVGSSCRFIPGATIEDGTFVGLGSVVTKEFKDKYVLIAGCPAVIKKRLNKKDLYFNRDYLPHNHHPKEYNGY